MSPAWVVENYLPDYKSKYDEYYADGRARSQLHERAFVEYKFPEALAEMLKAQREECLNCLLLAHHNSPYSDGSISPEWRNNAILDAPVPQPKN